MPVPLRVNVELKASEAASKTLCRPLLVERFALDDRWPVISKSFRQWVIEDDFVALAWEESGAQ